MKDRKSDKKGKHFYIRWKRVISVFLVFAIIVTMAGVNLYVQAENPLDVQSEEIKDITKETELSEEETKDTQENTPEDKQETKEEEIREAKDFSQLRELNYTLADFEPSGEDLWYQMKVDAYFEQLPESEAVLEGDTFSFRIPEELFYIEDTKNPVPVEIGSISGFGDKKAQCKDISAAEYTVKNQKVEVTLKKGISELEDISSVFMRMNLSVRVESKALDEQEKAADWVLATSSDGTEKKLSLILPAKENREDKDKADNNKEEKKEAAAKASLKKTEKTETKSEEEEKPSITVGGKEITFDENDTKKDALTQEVYWVDNNNPQNRPGKDKFQEFYIENAKIKATVTADGGTTFQEEISVKVLAERLGVKPEELIEVSDAGGTGHYRLSVNPGILPEKGSMFLNPEDPETENDVTFQWELMPPQKAPDQYYYMNEMDSEDEDVPKGWYYVKTQDFTVQIVQRSGDDKAEIEGLEEEILNTFSYYWKYNRGDDSEWESLTLKELLDSVQVEFAVAGTGPNEETIYTLTIKDIPIYRADGTVNQYYVGRTEAVEQKDIITGIDGLEKEDSLKISYENDKVANVGTVTDKVYNGGQVILTLSGTAEYTVHKSWGDTGVEEDAQEKRPDLEFQLWRYTKKDGEDYQHASPVQNKNGEIVILTMDSSKWNADEFTIDFQEGKNEDGRELPGLEKGNALLGDEKLPKYDPEGYEYIYFAREVVKSTSGAASYNKLYGEVVKNEDGTLSLKDILPDGQTTRPAADTSIYNGGTIVNQLSDKVKTKVEKSWEAASFQDEFQDVRVVMTLQSRVSEEPKGSWGTVMKNGKPVTVTLKDFSAEQLSQTGEVSSDKYDYDGYELEYRWVETAVYQGKDSTTNLLDPDTGKITLTQAGTEVSYTPEYGETIFNEEEKTYTTPVKNRMSDTIDYEVTKKWQDKDENPVDPPENAEISLQLYRQDHLTNVVETGPVIKLDGKTDEPKTFEVKLDEGEGGLYTVTYYEDQPWHLSVEGLPKYGSGGHEFSYVVLETAGVSGYVARYSTEFKDDTYMTTIINAPVGGSSIYVKKMWMDDSDVQHRGDVYFTVYERKGEKQFIPVAGADHVKITEQDFWWKEVGIPQNVKEEDLVVVETEVQNIQDPDRTVKISYTDEELETIYQELKEINAENETQENGNGAAIGSEDGNLEESDFKESGFGTLTEFHKEFDTDQHLYLQRYSIRQLENNKFYTVTNQRLGIIDLTVTKDWRDGEGDTREEFLNLLEEQGASLGVRLVCTDNEDAINYKDNTVDIGDGAYQIMKPAEQQDGEDSDDQTETLEKASAIQKIDTDTAKESTNYYFYNLPKYTQYGQAVHYTVEEVVIYEDDTVETFADFKKKNPKIIYNATMESTPYVTGEQHTHDTQTFQLHNSISGTKDVTFHKHWQDDYRNQLGERPDLSLDLYQRLHDNKDDRTEVVLKSYYKDYEWSRNENAGDDEVWDITLKGLPKYDRWGYEIDYYAKENVNISRETFDYLMPAYLYPADGTTYVEVGSETEGPKDSYKDEDYVIPLDNTNSTWLLKENGTFVNKIQEDVIFNGVKLWRLIPSGFPDAQLPEVTFSLYRKDLSGSGTDEKVAWVTIQNWEKDSSGSYRFALEYEGENKNKITDGKLEVTCGGDEKDAKRLQQYDENGRLYSYYIKEEIKLTKEDGSTVTAEEIYNSEISGSTITNGYNSEKGNLTVKKIVELGRDFAKGEKYPEVSFTLTRYYKDNAGKLCRDTSYSVTQTITAAMLEDGDGTAWATFPNLLIYAPNGTKYQYAINENMDKLKGGYEVFAGRGDLSEDQVTASYTPPADLENPNEDLLLEASKDDTETPDITYKNTRKADTVKLEGKKVWNDRDDDAGLRPDIDKNAITLEVSREAAAQGSGNAIPKQKLAEDEYEVVWEQDPDNKNNWTYTITGKDDTELEQYSPNGNPWKYTVKEILSEPWSSYYRYEKQEVVQSGTVTDSTIQMPDLKNSLLTSSIGYKKWVPKDSTDGLKSDYLGYKMKVTFQLQARVDGVVADGTLDKDQKSNWFAADKLLEKITSDKDLIPDPIQKTIGPNFILPNASNWGNAAFSNLLTAVKAEQEAADLGITQDSIVKIKYRVVETQAEYYKNSGGQDTLIYTQKYGVDMAKDTPEYTLEGAIGLFDQVTVTGSWVRNVLPTVKLEIWKIWKNDSHNAFNTRPQENGNSVVKFVVQRREKGSTDDNAWEIVKSYDKEGKATDLVRTLQLGNSTDSGRVIVEALPQYDFVIGADNTARKVEYEYRARELQAGADTSNGVKEQDILQDNDTFNTAYGSVVTDGAEAIKTETGKVVNSDSDYATAVTNTMKETEVYAEKEWKTDEIQVSASYPDVTLMLQYLKDDGSAQGTWTDFSPKAKVVLNGEQDTDTTKPYYEYEAWKALWKAPEVMPGSKLKDNKTQYRVVEVTDNTYPEEVESGTGTENDPYVFLFGTADGTKDSPYTITNDRTKLKIAKSAETGGLDEEFIFTIKPKDQRSRVKAYYVKYDAGGTAIQDGTGEGTLDMSSGGAASFTLKDGQYAVIYNLVREGQYLVTESGVKGEETSPDALKNYEITGENQDNLLTMTSSGKGQFSITTPETKPDQIPELTVTNRLQGKITIQKTDEKGKALSGVTFQLKWREKGSPEGTEYQVLDDTVCSNADLVTGVLVNGQEVPGTVTTDANGEAVFDGLYLGANGREYQITELAAKDGYNVLSEPVEGIEIPYETAIRTVNSEPWRRVKGKYYYLELTLTVENNKVFHMPNTSGTGFFWPGMGALAVAVAASGFYIWQKEGKYRKKRRKS